MIFPLCIVRGLSRWYTREKQLVTINHEKIHFQQSIELGVIGFYLIYLYWHLRYGYKGNPFEVEAFDNEDDLQYIDKRKRYNYFKR